MVSQWFAFLVAVCRRGRDALMTSSQRAARETLALARSQDRVVEKYRQAKHGLK